MGYSLGNHSLTMLHGVHPSIVVCVQRAIQLTTQDFTVFEGCRTLEQEQRDIDRGVSKLRDPRNGKHIVKADGFGHAVDLVPWIDGSAQWRWPAIYPIAAAMHQASREHGVKLIWGGCWDRLLSELSGDAPGLEKACQLYSARHPGPDFLDGPHFELA